MIPRASLIAWSARAPWPSEDQVEQDLVISRLLVEIAADPLLSKELAFRGGTCLHKLHLEEPLRYSEDLDFVRTNQRPLLGEIFDALRSISNRVGLREHRRRFPSRRLRCRPHLVRRSRGVGRLDDPRENRDQCRREHAASWPHLHSLRGRVALVERSREGPDLRGRGHPRHQGPGALPAPQGPRSVRPLARSQPPWCRRQGRSQRDSITTWGTACTAIPSSSTTSRPSLVTPISPPTCGAWCALFQRATASPRPLTLFA